MARFRRPFKEAVMNKDELEAKVEKLKANAKEASASIGQRRSAERAQPQSASPLAGPAGASSAKTAAGHPAGARRAEAPTETAARAQDVEDLAGQDIDIDIDPEIEESDDE
jgi:hypothetical protein